MDRVEGEVRRLGRESFEEVVATLGDAFHDYPAMRYVLKDAGGEYDARLAELVAYFTDSRLSRGYPILGVEHGGGLVAAANVNPPQPVPAPPSLEQRYRRLCDGLGEGAIARLEAFVAACEPLTPAEPHYYLGMIGVRRDCQGRGHARPLMEAVHELSAHDPDSTGVSLTTQTTNNLPFYERFGYRVVGQVEVEELRTWTMWRPDPTLVLDDVE